MLRYMAESNRSPKTVKFKRVTEDDKYISISNRIINFAKSINDGVIESLGSGVSFRTIDYTVIMLGDTVRINYYKDRTSIFEYVEIYLDEGETFYNIEEWPARLMQLYKDILNIANS